MPRPKQHKNRPAGTLRTHPRETGNKIEQLACDFLLRHGLQLLTSNFLCKCGEIDLVMAENSSVIVFVEVRYRKSSIYGNGAESVNKTKINKLVNAANCYLQKYNLSNKIPCRFDVISVLANNNIDWIKDAFWTQQT